MSATYMHQVYWFECTYIVNNNKNYHPSFKRSKKMKLRLKQIKP